MARLIYIAGHSGSGKSTAIRTLDPKTTYILNADAHELPFAYAKSYNEEIGNYTVGSDLSSVKAAFKVVQDNKKIKTLVIDTWSRIMTDYIMSKGFRTAPDGRKAWGKFAQDMYDLLNVINNNLRDDLIVYVLVHTESYYSDNGILSEKIGVHGQQLSKFVPESFSTVVLYTHIDTTPGSKPKYYFRTLTSGVDTCKTPIDMFKEELIPNDLKLVSEEIDKYYKS